eukprot:855895-Amphidinium_carterae.1
MRSDAHTPEKGTCSSSDCFTGCDGTAVVTASTCPTSSIESMMALPNRSAVGDGIDGRAPRNLARIVNESKTQNLGQGVESTTCTHEHIIHHASSHWSAPPQDPQSFPFLCEAACVHSKWPRQYPQI